jgi:serine/threonine-protein kinase RsbW
VATVKLEVPPRSAYVGVVRLALASLARTAGIDEESIEHLKIAVSEACANAVLAHDELDLEDAFEVVRELGGGIVVGDPPPADTRAVAWLRDPTEVRELIHALAVED